MGSVTIGRDLSGGAFDRWLAMRLGWTVSMMMKCYLMQVIPRKYGMNMTWTRFFLRKHITFKKKNSLMMNYIGFI